MSFLEPIDIAGKRARNRIALAAMTNRQSGDDGVLGADEKAWLVSRARGGFGIVATCGAYVSSDGRGFDGQLGIADDRHAAGLAELAPAIRAEGALAIAQIFHAGVRAPSRLTGARPWSASEFSLEVKSFERPRAATGADIDGAIDAFAAAARRAAQAGFDGVEIHGAHGYLLTQFLGTVTNTRTDEWGGSLENRARLIRRVAGACAEATPDDFIVGVRVSPEVADQGVDLDDSLTVARWLVDDGVDFLHVSNWDSFKRPEKYPDVDRPLTRWFRDAVGERAVIIATGAVWTADQAEAVIDHGADIVGLGRAAIFNPRWPIDAAASSWEPVRPPQSPEVLASAGIGPAFVEYLRRFKTLVATSESP